jgi:hypothetical protein
VPGSESYVAFVLSEPALAPRWLKSFFLPQMMNSKRRLAQVGHSAKLKALPSSTSGLGPYSISACPAQRALPHPSAASSANAPPLALAGTLRPEIPIQAQEADPSLLLPLGRSFAAHALTSVTQAVGLDGDVDERGREVVLGALGCLGELEGGGLAWEETDKSEVV